MSEDTLGNFFLRFLLARGMRTQADLVDQLFNSSEKRLARILLLMAEMIGTTRFRVSVFKDRFCELGFISNNGRIQVHKLLLHVVLLDQLSEHNSEKPRMGFVG